MLAFRHSALPCDLVAVDVSPRLDGGEGELVGSQADDFTVLVVHCLGPFALQSAAAVQDIGNPGDGGKFGTGEVVQRVEVYVVDGGTNGIGELVACVSKWERWR